MTERPTPEPATILLVEDADSVRVLVREILREAGYAVIEARGGEEALQAASARKGPIDLLLADMYMPGGMDGRELAIRLREERRELKVIYMSGHEAGSRALKTVVEGGGDSFLQKPFVPEVLERKVRDVLGKPPAR